MRTAQPKSEEFLANPSNPDDLGGPCQEISDHSLWGISLKDFPTTCPICRHELSYNISTLGLVVLALRGILSDRAFEDADRTDQDRTSLLWTGCDE